MGRMWSGHWDHLGKQYLVLMLKAFSWDIWVQVKPVIHRMCLFNGTNEHSRPPESHSAIKPPLNYIRGDCGSADSPEGLVFVVSGMAEKNNYFSTPELVACIWNSYKRRDCIPGVFIMVTVCKYQRKVYQNALQIISTAAGWHWRLPMICILENLNSVERKYNKCWRCLGEALGVYYQKHFLCLQMFQFCVAVGQWSPITFITVFFKTKVIKSHSDIMYQHWHQRQTKIMKR